MTTINGQWNACVAVKAKFIQQSDYSGYFDPIDTDSARIGVVDKVNEINLAVAVDQKKYSYQIRG